TSPPPLLGGLTHTATFLAGPSTGVCHLSGLPGSWPLPLAVCRRAEHSFSLFTTQPAYPRCSHC
ncbi:MAG: hypothetical protein ACREQ3_27325, partial [Candidatus Binatia bacterium]